MASDARVTNTLIVDDEEDMRVLLRAVINAANQGLRADCEASDGDEAVSKWRSYGPDIVILDQRMPVMSGLDAAAKILAEDPEQAIVLFSAFVDDDLTAAAHEIGIRACLSKDRIRDLPGTLWALAV